MYGLPDMIDMGLQEGRQVFQERKLSNKFERILLHGRCRMRTIRWHISIQ